MNIYLWLNIFTIGFPLLLSFDKKVAYFRSWGALFPGILFSGAVFIIWDVWFTAQGVWEFNPEYLVGWYLFGLPLEEWLFFLTVPYACVFIYACLNAYVPKDILGPYAYKIAWFLVGALPVLALLNLDKLYTTVTFFGLTGWLLLNLLVIRPPWLGRFFLAYLVVQIPFALVNGILTALPVVIYNNAENLSLRLGTIPVEDTMYNMLLLLMTINVYEYLRKRKGKLAVEKSV